MNDEKKHLTINSVINFHTCIQLFVLQWEKTQLDDVVGLGFFATVGVGGEVFFALPPSTEVGAVFVMMTLHAFYKTMKHCHRAVESTCNEVR